MPVSVPVTSAVQEGTVRLSAVAGPKALWAHLFSDWAPELTDEETEARVSDVVSGESHRWQQKAKVLVLSPVRLCDPMTPSLHRNSQARILEWVAVSFSRGSSWPRDRTQVSRIAGRFFTIWATRGVLITEQDAKSWVHPVTMLLLSPLHEHIAVLGLVELPQSIGHLSALEKFTMYPRESLMHDRR